MNTLKSKFFTAICLMGLFLFSGCSDDDDTLSSFTVNFNSTELGISPTSTKAEVTLTFSRPATVEGIISLSIDLGTLTYGESADFYTSVAPIDDTILLPFSNGDQSVSFTILAGAASVLTQEAVLIITITEDDGAVYTTGSDNQLNVNFDENFISQGASLSAKVNELFDLRAYIDLSKASTDIVEVDNYDLGFHSGDGFYVTLNASTSIMARPLDKNNLTEVTATDTIGFFGVMTIPPPNFDPAIGSVAWIDTPDGNLETTAFGEISSSDIDNKVFILKRDKGNWKKVRVLRDGDNYVLQHADIEAANFETLTISKDPSFEVVTVDLDFGIVEATPENDKWDFIYGTYTEILNLGGPGVDIPYGFKDYITTNRSDVSVIMVLTSDNSYEAFTTADLNGLEFDSEINSIGSSWRQGGGPGTPPSILEDRFYILRDGEQNIYKLKFTSMYGAGDVRGEISFIYEILN